MEYPIFSLSEDGSIETSGTVVDDTVQSVSGGDASGSPADLFADYPVSTLTEEDVAAVVSYALDEELSALQDDVSYLASQSASSAGYISSTILDTFDRVLQQYDYDYYCAFRTGSDSYAAVLYLSDTFTYDGNSLYMNDSLAVELYRVNDGSYYNNYEYYYSTASAGNIEIDIDSDLMYYTNCIPGYPALGEVPNPTHYSNSSTLVICLLIIIVFLLFFRRSKR